MEKIKEKEDKQKKQVKGMLKKLLEQESNA